MDEQDPSALNPPAPMVLRKLPPERRRLARSLTVRGVDTAGGTWWEFVDIATGPDNPPAGVALTHLGSDSSVTVSALGIRDADAVDGYADLLLALVATFRSGSADTVLVDGTDPAVRQALIAVGFARVKDSNRYLIAL